MAIDPPYRLDPFRNIINIHFKTKEECPPEGEGYPGLVIVASPWNSPFTMGFVDFYMAINVTGPHYTGNPLWPDGSPYPALCQDAGVALDEAIGTDSGITYVSAVSVIIPYVVVPETGRPTGEEFASAVAYDWQTVQRVIDYYIEISGLTALQPYANAAYQAAYDNYYDTIAQLPDGQQQSSNDATQTYLHRCGQSA